VEKKITLAVIDEPDPGTCTMVDLTHEGPFVKSNGNLTCLCGNCGNVLLEKIRHGQFQAMIIRCGKCRAFNDFFNSPDMR